VTAAPVWQPTYYLGYGAEVARFMENWIVQTKGRWAGQPIRLEPWQHDWLGEAFLERSTPTGGIELVYREAMLGIARKNGKALDVETPIPTPDGWTTIGELVPGDWVFGPDGRTVAVNAVTPPMLERPCRSVTFSDGASIVADAEHEWLTDDRARGWGVRTTDEIAATLVGANGRRHRIAVAAPLDLTPIALAVDPYTLGAWLGDGHTHCARLTNVDPEVWQAIPYDLGRPMTATAETRTVLGIQGALRTLGVLGCKHIPVAYLRASEAQRMALLRGLMDTDGCISARGLCEFDTTNVRLLADVRALIHTLGWKTNVVSRRAKLNGLDIGPKWTVQFTAYNDRPVFTIPRKLNRQKPPPPIRTRSQVRQIVAVEPVASRPVRCIEVDGGLYLAGEHFVTTHNSTLSSGIALHGLLATGENSPEVYAAAASTEQARIVFDQAKRFVEASPKLQDWLKPYRSVIECEANGGIFRVLSADGPLQHGLNPSLVVIDELWAHRNPELYYALTTGQGARENPLIVDVTTAGFDRKTVCHHVFEHGQRLQRAGLHAMREERFFFQWFAAEQGANIEDRDQWLKANPSSWIDIDGLERERKRLPPNVFRRLHMNQWTEVEDAWITPAAWDRCRGYPVFDPLLPVYMAVDVGITRDSAAMVWGQWHGEDLHVGQLILLPEEQAEGFGVSDVRGHVGEQAASLGTVKEVAFDPWSFRESAEMLADRGVPMVEFPQNSSRMAPASELLYEMVEARRIVHDGSEELRRQVLAAVAAPTERGGWRISKRKSRERIDACISLAMVVDRAVSLKLEKPVRRRAAFL
jgi:phage terminase large subunit-like protein